MNQETEAELIALAERLFNASPEKFNDVMHGLRDVVEGQEIIARFDWLHRASPRERLEA